MLSECAFGLALLFGWCLICWVFNLKFICHFLMAVAAPFGLWLLCELLHHAELQPWKDVSSFKVRYFVTVPSQANAGKLGG
jgi:hypothetical protein